MSEEYQNIFTSEDLRLIVKVLGNAIESIKYLNYAFERKAFLDREINEIERLKDKLFECMVKTKLEEEGLKND